MLQIARKILKAFVRRQSITTRLGLGVGILLALIFTVALTGYLSLYNVGKAQDAIRISTEIQGMVLVMDRAMERARHLHANFFLQYPSVGLAAAHEQYAQPSVREVARAIHVSHALKERINQSTVSAALQKSDVDLNLYLSSAKRFADTSIASVELLTELTAPARGLEAQLDRHLEDLESQMTSDDLIHGFIEINSHVQDYRVSRKRSLMQSAFNSTGKLRQAVIDDKSAMLSPKKKERIEKLLDQFVTTANRILDVDAAIKAKFNDFALQAEAVAPISRTLTELAGAEVAHAKARIDSANRRAHIIMAIITLAGLILAATIGWALNNSITQRVVRLTASARELQTGNLKTFAQESGNDELSELARSFNAMAARIGELVDHLELKVKERTAALAESEQRFRDLFEHSTSGVAIYEGTPDGEDFIFKDVNKAVERIERVERGKIIGKRVTEAFPGVEDFGLLKVFKEVAQTGRSAHHPVEFYSDGRLRGWRENWVYRLPSGEIVTIYSDMTAQKQAELEKKEMENQLQQARKMEAIGVLAGGVAHDFNNILGIILGNAELAREYLPADHPVAHHLNEIRNASLRAKEVIRRLLSFSRKTENNHQPISILPLVQEALSLMRASIPADIEIEPILPRHCPLVVADPAQIHQVIINLCTNAAHAMEETGGTLRVALSEILIDSKDASDCPEAGPGAYVQLTVSDTGCGIPQDNANRIFEPYFTTKEIGKGSGMGLAVVHGIIQSHGGTISVYSEPERGSTFKILLPTVENQPAARALPGKKALGAGEKILIVDDEEALANMVRMTLSRYGYQVESTTDPHEALEKFSAGPNEFDLIITDMAMPGINGSELSKKILKEKPSMPIILCSGYSEIMDADKAAALGIRKYLEKPLMTEDLVRAVRDVLDQ